MAGYFTESNYENAVLQLLNEELGYNYIYGPDVERDYHSPLYEDVLLPSLQRINKSLPMDALTEAIYKLKNFETGTLLQKNMVFRPQAQIRHRLHQRDQRPPLRGALLPQMA